MSRAERFLFSAAAFVVVIAGIRAASSLVVPFLLAVFITIVVTPAYLAMRRRGISNVTSLLVLLIFLAAIAFGGVNLVGKSVRDFTQRFPQYQKALVAQREALFRWLESKHISPEKLRLEETLDPRYVLRYAGTLASALSGLIGQAFLVFLIVVFMLLEVSMLPRKIAKIPYLTGERWAQMVEAVHNVRRYVAIKTLVSVLTGLSVGLWCWILGLDQVPLLALLAFLLNYIPTIGSIIAAIPALLIALTVSGLGKMILCALGYLIINVFFGNILEPRWMGRRLGLSPLVVLVSIFFWGWVLGPAGMLFSVPLTMALKIVLQHDPGFAWVSTMLGNATEADLIKETATTQGTNV